MIRNILVPTDFGDASREAFACAREMAAALGAGLHVLHVIETDVIPAVSMEMYIPPSAEYLGRVEASARMRLEAWVPADDKTVFRIERSVRLGAPAEEILKRVDDKPKIDLIVMATHGRRGVKRLLLGSVAEQVVRRAHCPVLTVKGADSTAEHAA